MGGQRACLERPNAVEYEPGLCLPAAKPTELATSGQLRHLSHAREGEIRWLLSFFDNLVVVRVASVVEADRSNIGVSGSNPGRFDARSGCFTHGT